MAAAFFRQTVLSLRNFVHTGSLLPAHTTPVTNLLSQHGPIVTQCCTIYDWRIQKDMKRRSLTKEYFPLRTRINGIRKNSILPRELQEIADQEIAALPRDSCRVRIRNRCVMTARPRGVLRRWRLSRIVWRNLADYNKLSGVTRACW